MSVLVNKNTRLLVQGITGEAGSFHAKQMIAYGTSVVGGVTPGAVCLAAPVEDGGQRAAAIVVPDVDPCEHLLARFRERVLVALVEAEERRAGNGW